jgi:hypothetical protein
VVEAAESSLRYNTTFSYRRNSASGCFLVQSGVGAVMVIIEDVPGEKSFQVVLVQSDDMIEEIPTIASDPALSNAVLPGTLDRGFYARHVHRTNRNGRFQPVLLVVIEEEELGRGLIRKSFS